LVEEEKLSSQCRIANVCSELSHIGGGTWPLERSLLSRVALNGLHEDPLNVGSLERSGNHVKHTYFNRLTVASLSERI
jgi:hypothetical protein